MNIGYACIDNGYKSVPLQIQIDELNKIGCKKIYSSVDTNIQQLLDKIKKDEILFVYHSEIFRYIGICFILIEELTQKGASLSFIKDPNSPLRLRDRLKFLYHNLKTLIL